MRRVTKCLGKHCTTDTSLDNTSTISNSAIDSPPEELVAMVLGTWQKWQVMCLIIFCSVMVFQGLNIYMSEILLSGLDFNCANSSTKHRLRSSCSNSTGNPCHNLTYIPRSQLPPIEKPKTYSWSLTCPEWSAVELSIIIFHSGMACGYIISGYIADKWGRKTLFIFVAAVPCIAVMVTGSRTYKVFIIIRFFHGLVVAGPALIIIIYVCELSPNKWRSFQIGLLNMSFAIGHLLTPYLWKLSESNLHKMLIASLPQALIFGFIRILHESPIWLLTKSKVVKTEKIIKAVARFNGSPFPSACRLRPLHVIIERNMWVRSNFLKSCCVSKTSCLIVALCLIWFTLGLSYNTMVIYFLMQKDIWKNLFFSGICSVAAAFLSTILCYLIKQKTLIGLSTLTATITFTLNKYDLPIMYLSTIGLYSFAIFTLINMTPRLIPTEMRGEGTGTMFAIGEIALVCSRLVVPYIKSRPIYLYVLWTCTVLICFWCIALLNIHNRELPDNIDDLKNFKSAYKPPRWTWLRAQSPTLVETEVNLIELERIRSMSFEVDNTPRKKIAKK